MSERFLVAGQRVAWVHGPSGINVVGRIVCEDPESPSGFWPRILPPETCNGPGIPTQRIWRCVEEKTLGCVSHPGAEWRVPLSDFTSFDVPDSV
jgi:hypothetical protein